MFSPQYPVLVSIHLLQMIKGVTLCINMQSYMCVHAGVCVCVHLCVNECISITFGSADKSKHSALFVRVISCMRLCVYVPDQAYLHLSFTAIQIIYSPPGLQHGFWPASFIPAAGLRSIPQTLPAISYSLSCMAHRWTSAGTEHFITTACREKQRQTGRWAQGSRRPLLGWDIP